MKAKQKISMLSGLLAMSLLLGACGDKTAPEPPSSGFGTQPPQTTVTAAQPPQTTASPQEQTGFGYQAEWTELPDQSASKLLELNGTIYVETTDDSGTRLVTLEDGAVELKLETYTVTADDKQFWYCIETDEGLSMVAAEPDGTTSDPVALEHTEEQHPLPLIVDGAGNFYLNLGSSIQVFSPTGKRLAEFPSQGSVRELVRLKNGQVLMNRYADDPEGRSVALVNTESIGASLTDGTLNYRVFSGWDSTALLSGGGNLYTLDTETGEMQVLLNWVDTGVDPETLVDLVALGPEQIEVLTSAQGENIQRLTLRQVPADSLEEKTVINVGLGNLAALPAIDTADTALRDAVTAQAVAFNRESGDYRIHLVDYSVYADCDQRLQGDLQDLDLVICEKSVLEGADLTALTELGADQENLVSGVAEGLEAEGMTSLPLYFTVKTLVGCKDILGDSQGWTPAEFLAAVQANPDAVVLRSCNAYDTLDAITAAAGGAVEDYGSLLEAASGVPADDGAICELEGNGTGSVYTYLREGKLLLLETELRQFMDLRTLEAAVGENLVLKGYPTDQGNGAVLDMPLRLAIPGSSKNKDAVWSFLQELLSDSAETLSQMSIGFPAEQSSFDAMAQEAMSGIRYEDESGQTVEEDVTVWVDGQAVTAPAMTQTDVDAFRDYCAASSGGAGGSEELRDRARSALKRVLEEDVAPQTAAEDIS